MTRQGRTNRADPCTCGNGDRLSPFLSILANNIQVYGTATEGAPPFFIVKTLIERGSVCYDKYADVWAAFSTTGPRYRTGMPRKIRLVGDMGRLSADITLAGDKYDRYCIFPANAYFFAPKKAVRDKVDSVRFIENATMQNIDALRQIMAVFYDDPDLNDQLEAAEKKRLDGCPTAYIQKKPGASVDIKPLTAGAQSHISDMIELYAQTIEELDVLTGRAAIGEKNERRVTDEIVVLENSAYTSIDVIIDTFNRFADWYGVDAHAVRGVEIKRKEVEKNGRTLAETGDERGSAEHSADGDRGEVSGAGNGV